MNKSTANGIGKGNWRNDAKPLLNELMNRGLEISEIIQLWAEMTKEVESLSFCAISYLLLFYDQNTFFIESEW